MEKNVMIIIGIAALVFLLWFVGGFAVVAEAVTVPGKSYVCTGEVEVDLLGIGSPELSPEPVCYVSDCKKIPGAAWWDWFLPSVENGRVEMVALYPGSQKVIDAYKYESIVGENELFTLKSGCIDEPDGVRMDLYNGDGARTHWCVFDGVNVGCGY